jgi:steroid delta-isomerase-like uncharacterized protein
MILIYRLTYFALLAFLTTACNNDRKRPGNDVIESNRQLGVRYFEEVWNKGNINLLDTLLDPAYVNHTPSVPTSPGPGGLKPIVMAIRRGFPDLHYDIQSMIVTNDYLTMRVEMTGTHTDTLFDIPPTGKKIRVMQINVEKITDGRITEHWRVTDELTMMKQLGIVK